MTRAPRSILYCFVVAVTAILSSRSAAALQEAQMGNPSRERATRGELTEMAARADSLSKLTDDKKVRERYEADAHAARNRLTEGDLRTGDKIVLEVLNFPELNGELTVRSGQLLEIPTLLSSVPLRGVLRTELDEHLTNAIAKYHRNPRVRTIPMIRLSVSGGVLSPGFKYARMDVILSDVITLAAGYTPDANTQKMQIRRGANILWQNEQITTAMRDGWSLDSLQLIGGDEIFVARKNPQRVGTILAFTTSAIGLIISIMSLSRR